MYAIHSLNFRTVEMISLAIHKTASKVSLHEFQI